MLNYLESGAIVFPLLCGCAFLFECLSPTIRYVTMPYLTMIAALSFVLLADAIKARHMIYLRTRT
jgi:hypothetical protein